MNFKQFNASFEDLLLQRDNCEQEIVQKLIADHETEITEYKQVQEEKELEIRHLKEENARLKESAKNSNDECEALRSEVEKFDKGKQEMEKRVQEVLIEKEKAVKETAERLHENHKAEIDSIRSRFKLMMSDRSPSETSLEKFDFRDESVVKHTKIEIEEALAQETKKWQRKVEEIQLQHEISLDDARRQISDEKEKQIMMLQERVANLNLECMKHKNTIQQLAESDIQYQNSELLRKIDLLEKEKCEVQAELEKIKQQDLTASVAIVEGSGAIVFIIVLL